ncbi:junctional sarcoplasmic reticulum protein 1 [Poecilia formosa]|uniref:junctional sarcoplasmic reticulum protein 1 n=1 Tax=Poecilia formosa TaxID=48698 RepID=UPI0004448A20|nr:PREDICTED: junctional sarcoplasmic reticulum protein 1-like [Poecilia formosa]
MTKGFLTPDKEHCMSRGGMEESYETFEEELWPPRADAPPQRPVRQIRRASGEMYTARKIREEVPPVSLQPRSEPKLLPKEPSSTKPTFSHKTLSIQNPTQPQTPWENVTLNRCLFVAIGILVLTSGFQKLHETLRGQGTIEEEEEAGLTMRRSELLRRRGRLPEPETSLWEVMFWWLPDLDDEDEDEEDDDEEIKRRKSKRGVTRRTSRGLRNRPLPEKKLLKQRDGKLKDRRARKARANKIKDKRGRARKEDPEEAADKEDERGDKCKKE